MPNEITMMTTNLPGGYQRDLQLLKENLFPAFGTLHNCIDMASLMLNNISVKDNILDEPKYKYLFSVEEVNKLVLKGVPFREAYKKVGLSIEENTFNYEPKVKHTHEGSIGNLQNESVAKMMKKITGEFNFSQANNALNKLISED